MWLQAEQREVAGDCALGDARMRRYAAHAPVGSRGGLAVQYLAQQGRYARRDRPNAKSKHYADSIVVDTLGAIEGRTTVCPAAIVAL
jgi:hypothetical protein